MMNVHVFRGEQLVMGQGIIRGHTGRGACLHGRPVSFEAPVIIEVSI
jgi:hypothetical protein